MKHRKQYRWIFVAGLFLTTLLLAGCGDDSSYTATGNIVSGQILDGATDEPVADVTVQLLDMDFEPYLDPDAFDSVEAFNEANSEAFVSIALTDSDGMYVMEDVPNGHYAVVPEKSADPAQRFLLPDADTNEIALTDNDMVVNFVRSTLVQSSKNRVNAMNFSIKFTNLPSSNDGSYLISPYRREWIGGALFIPAFIPIMTPDSYFQRPGINSGGAWIYPDGLPDGVQASFGIHTGFGDMMGTPNGDVEGIISGSDVLFTTKYGYFSYFHSIDNYFSFHIDYHNLSGKKVTIKTPLMGASITGSAPHNTVWEYNATTKKMKKVTPPLFTSALISGKTFEYVDGTSYTPYPEKPLTPSGTFTFSPDGTFHAQVSEYDPYTTVSGLAWNSYVGTWTIDVSGKLVCSISGADSFTFTLLSYSSLSPNLNTTLDITNIDPTRFGYKINGTSAAVLIDTDQN